MADTFTPNYNFTRPEVNASRDTWGTKWNDNISAIDVQLKSLFDTKATRDELNALRTELTNLLTARLPSGIIAKWKGSVATIPAGWVICDGLNGTPDLRDRFIVGASTSASYAVGATGGATTHAHPGSETGSTAITIAQMPPHNHGVSDPGHNHSGVTDTQGVHAHTKTYNYRSSGTGEVGASATPFAGYAASLNTTAVVSNDPAGAHAHNLAINGAYTNISTVNAGSGHGHAHTTPATNTVDHRPPYFALCFIMKT